MLQNDQYYDDSMNLNTVNKHKSILHRSENAFKRKNRAF